MPIKGASFSTSRRFQTMRIYPKEPLAAISQPTDYQQLAFSNQPPGGGMIHLVAESETPPANDGADEGDLN